MTLKRVEVRVSLLKPRISVLLPVQNGAPYIEAALDSLWRQTEGRFEVIVFDNGSTDETPKLLERIQASDDANGRLEIVTYAENQGISRCMNEGIRVANGDWIARMDADDVAKEHRFQSQLQFLDEHPDCWVCGGWARVFTNRKYHIHRPPTDPDTIRCMFAFQNPLVHSTVMWNRKRLMDECLWYDETLDAAQDFDLWYRVSRKGSLGSLPEVAVAYRVHENSVSSTRAARSDLVWRGIVSMALEPLQVSLDEKQWEIHRLLAKGTGCSKQDALESIACWVEELRQQNMLTGAYPLEAFSQALAWCWYRCCLNSAVIGSTMPKMWAEVASTLSPAPHTSGIGRLRIASFLSPLFASS